MPAAKVRLLPTRQNSTAKNPGGEGAGGGGGDGGGSGLDGAAFCVFEPRTVSVLTVPSEWAALVGMTPRDRRPKKPASARMVRMTGKVSNLAAFARLNMTALLSCG